MAREEGLKNIVSELPIADTDSGITAPKIKYTHNYQEYEYMRFDH